MSTWDAMSYEGKDTILRVVREEANRLFEMAEQPGVWEAPTACESWAVRDVVGHIVDTTEGYFAAFETARSGGEATAHGLAAMHELAGQAATEFRDLSQPELIARARADLDRMMGILEPLTAEEWTGLIVPHSYMGPVPAFIYAAGQLMDFTVHSWDIRQGSGRAHGLPADAADLLVPFMFIIWQSTVRTDHDPSPFSLGVTVSGRNAGSYRIDVADKGMSYEQGDVSDLPTVIDFDPGSMVLTAFGRSNSGTVRGDLDVADRFLNLFFRI
jgi:uncharacterized protein (TIGR03083 family)